ncbi:hypothetical protein EUX98_g8778 [Antrodiella citrinella]|uniref:Uncharacterized protein n=1 Tax=Antrodiella citrinella TaxID=2447956 RepID=A0A4S4M309_9APHY|nr:hypothetical protein EUX98_g8778 [Antrodiella citrinella]
MVGTRPSNTDKHPGQVVLQQTATRAPRRTRQQIEAANKAATEAASKKDQQEMDTRGLLLAKIAALEMKLASKEVSAHQAIPVTGELSATFPDHASESTKTHSATDELPMEVDEAIEPVGATTSKSKSKAKATRADVDALRLINATSSSSPAGKRKLTETVQVESIHVSSKKAKVVQTYPIGAAMKDTMAKKSRVATPTQRGCGTKIPTSGVSQAAPSRVLTTNPPPTSAPNVHRSEPVMGQFDLSTIDPSILSAAVVAKLKAENSWPYLSQPENSLPSTHTSASTAAGPPTPHDNQVVYGGYVSDGDDNDEPERPTTEGVRCTNQTTVGITMNQPQPSFVVGGNQDEDEHTDLLANFRASTHVTRFRLEHLPLPQQAHIIYKMHVIKPLLALIGEMSDPWCSKTFFDLVGALRTYWRAVFPANHADLGAGSPVHELARSKIYAYRHGITSAAVKALQAYIQSKLPKLTPESDAAARAAYTAQRVQMTREYCTKGLGFGYPFTSIAVRTSKTTGRPVHVGRFLNPVLLMTFSYHLKAAGIIPVEGLDELDESRMPVGALALCLSALEWALRLHESGEYNKRHPLSPFTYATWGSATGKYALSVDKVKMEEWHKIINGAAAISSKDHSYAGDSDSDNDDRSNINAADSDADVESDSEFVEAV